MCQEETCGTVRLVDEIFWLGYAQRKVSGRRAVSRDNFREFVIGRRWDDSFSDFTRDAFGDLDLPEAHSWEQLETYIKGRNPNAPASTFSAAKHIWQLYANR